MKSRIAKLTAATLFALGTTTSAMAEDDRYIIQVDNINKGVVKALSKKMGGKINVDSNGFIAVTFSGKRLARVKSMLNSPHIRKIEDDQRRYPTALFNDDVGDPGLQQITPYAVYQSEANLLTLQLASAKKVCIIDAGIARETGEIGTHNPDFDWSVITGDSDPGTNDWFRDGGAHGTHVAGTVAAADNGIGVIGMAPGNPLHIIKVFNDAGWGYSSNLVQAKNLCEQAGAEIITMSLSGPASSVEETAFNDFEANGGLILAAAGNDGNSVRAFPAGYKSVMMIGANDNDNNIADFSQFPNCTRNSVTDDGHCVEVSAGGVNTLSTYPGGSAVIASMSADSVFFSTTAMENQGNASGSSYFMNTAEATDPGASGKICVIDRGNISFHDKVLNCENSGGIGAIIINNVPGGFSGTLGSPNLTTIPAVTATFEDRSALVNSATASVSVTPGDYGLMSGTSMATPAVAGMAALVWSNHPTCTATEIRNALKATAEDQGTPGKDVNFGFGIVKAKQASDFLTANPCGGPPPPPPTGDQVMLTSDGFESGLGNWSNASGVDSHNWTRDSGGTPSSSTGPSSGSGGSSWYMYLETSSAGGGAFNAGDTAVLNSANVSATDVSLKFDYHMFGSNMGTLAIDVFSGGSWNNNVWSISGQQHTSNGSAYTAADVDLSAFDVEQIRFRATAAGSWQGDMAIDNVEVWGVPGEAPPTQVISSSDFETGMGDWINPSASDDYDWTRDSNGTPSSNTGPTQGANGSDFYMYLETSNGSGAFVAGDTAFLESVDLGGSNRTLTFDYHMFGSAMGTLSVDVFSGGSWTNDIWSISGQQHASGTAAYTGASVDLSSFTGTIKLRFRGTAVGGWQGDIAIDNLVVTEEE